mmetsp:Transcript_10653/g.30304  ORF Transcript_10653/g.30304 Transcript_10653/m.30304 type:complete len:219 (+) Transcript_10653:746-1402(+)|eukprot:CAMPEP_0117670486 /NCGR_PEP_ID=MMETSP0804-20121206/12785_1 /TAXON_ID=1074897 /ORGANISM="Tetraselmis astigmatica, Strain CCMP880" /LENGTH=218 /DNA_ID=CAMNT_0005478801 /DNA_START=714 /DNA_END=1370 /DNA_ORIENTATION=-
MATRVIVNLEPAESACSTCCGDNFNDITSSSLEERGYKRTAKSAWGSACPLDSCDEPLQRKRHFSELDPSCSDTGSGDAMDYARVKRQRGENGQTSEIRRRHARRTPVIHQRLSSLLAEREQLQQANRLLVTELIKYRKALVLQAQENTSLRSHISILGGGKSVLTALGVGPRVDLKPMAQISNSEAEAVAAAALAKAGNNPVEALRILMRLAKPIEQ